MTEETYTLSDLRYLINRLRDPQSGCPWDIKQNYRSIIPHTLEEVYEVVDAIEREDYGNLEEELGDLLLQIALYCQFAEEEARFGIEDVISGLVEKLIRRHPHVFPEGTLQSKVDPNSANSVTTEDVQHRWEAIKRAEKDRLNARVPETETAAFRSILSDLPTAFPAMLRALKIQKRASKVGFDWNSLDKVIEKLNEEVQELQVLQAQLHRGGAQERAEYSDKDRRAVESEVGDILFACVNIARTLKVDPEAALRSTNRKFEQRFHYIEKTVKAQGSSIEEATLTTMERLWQEAKKKV